jgi:hypothetical protein
MSDLGRWDDDGGSDRREAAAPVEAGAGFSTGARVCAECGTSFPSRSELREHQRAGYLSLADRGRTGTASSGQTGTTPPAGTGGVATP